MSQTTPVPPLIPGDAYFSDVQTDQPIVTKSSVTQLTSITTPVTINAAAGTIVTVSSTLAVGATASFSVVNSFCASATSGYNTLVLATVNGYSGSTGVPVVASCVPSATGFTVTIANVGLTGSVLNGTVTIGFLVC